MNLTNRLHGVVSIVSDIAGVVDGLAPLLTKEDATHLQHGTVYAHVQSLGSRCLRLEPAEEETKDWGEKYESVVGMVRQLELNLARHLDLRSSGLRTLDVLSMRRELTFGLSSSRCVISWTLIIWT